MIKLYGVVQAVDRSVHPAPAAHSEPSVQRQAGRLSKLEELLGLDLAGRGDCWAALERCDWDVRRAADFLITNPPGQESPELIRV